MTSRGNVKPTFWGSLTLTPHRENPQRTQCPSCKGGGEINAIRCRDCNGRGWHDTQHPLRTGKAAFADDDAY